MKRCCWFFIAVYPAFLLADIYVCKDIVENTRWEGQVWINGDVTIHKNTTLTIAPGTRIVFEAGDDINRSGKSLRHVELIVLGKLIALGEDEDQKIIFTSNAKQPQMNDWYGIVLKNRAMHSRFRYCVIEYAYKGITCYGSSPEIDDCEIQFNQYAGISCEVHANPRIRGSFIFGNQFAGINSEFSARPLVERCIISQNANGVVVFDEANADLGVLRAQKNQSIGENLIFNNHEANIYNNSKNEIYAQNNIWHTENQDDIEDTLFDATDQRFKGEVIFKPAFGNSALKEDKPVAVKPALDNTKKARTVSSKETVREIAKRLPRKPWRGTVYEGSSRIIPVAGLPQQARPVYTKRRRPSRAEAIPFEEVLFSDASLKKQRSFLNQSSAGNILSVRTQAILPGPLNPAENVGAGHEQPILEVLLDKGSRRYIRRVKPGYPPAALRNRYEGSVLLEVTVGINGLVKRCNVLWSDGESFTQSAIQAVYQFQYSPGTFNGKSVCFNVLEPFIFRLKALNGVD